MKKIESSSFVDKYRVIHGRLTAGKVVGKSNTANFTSHRVTFAKSSRLQLADRWTSPSQALAVGQPLPATNRSMTSTLTVFVLLMSLSLQMMAQDKTNRLDYYFAHLAKQHQLNGTVLVAQKGKIIYQRSFGYADFDTKRLNTATSAFPIASITKLFTATAILQLQQQGKLKVNDRVVSYLPQFPYPTITITHLLAHTSGLPPYDELFEAIRQQHPDTTFTNKDILPRYAAGKKPLLYPPGQAGNYDNINFIFLSLLIEKVSHLPYQAYVRRFILQPAGMSHTFFPTGTLYHYTPQEKNNLSVTYRYPHVYADQVERTDTIPFVERYWHAYQFEGFGELISTTHDLFKFDQALYEQQLLSQASLQEAFTPIKLINGQVNPIGNGLGWQIKEDSLIGKLVWHSGGMIGLQSMFLRNVTKHQTVIILDNAQHDAPAIAQQALLLVNGQTVKVPGRSLAQVVGNLLVAHQVAQARQIIEGLKYGQATYWISEAEFNTLGYDFMSSHQLSEALATFKTNTQLFPKSGNTYDSYGEALEKDGQDEEAIKMYRKSLALDKTNEHARNALEKLLKRGHS